MGWSSTKAKKVASIKPKITWQWALLFLASCIFLAGIIIALLPLGLERGLEKWLRDQGVEQVEVENVDFNPFTGKLVVHGINASHKGEEVLDVGRMTVEIDWKPLLKKHVRFRELSIENSTMDVGWHADGSWSIGGLAMPQEGSQGEEPWGFGFLDIELRDIRVTYRDPTMQRQVTLSHANIGPIRSWNRTDPTGFDIRIKSEEGLLELKGDAKPLGKNPSVSAHVKINNLSLGWFSPHLKRKEIGSFTAVLDGEAKVNAGLNSDKQLEAMVLEGTLNIKDLGLELKQASLQLHQKNSSLTGSFDYRRGNGYTVAADAVSKNVKIDSTKRNLNIVTLKELIIKGFMLDGTGITTQEARLGGAQFLQQPPMEKRVKDEPSHMLVLKELVIRKAGVIDMKRIDIGTMDLRGADGWITKDAEGKMGLLSWIEPEQQAEKQDAKMSVRIGKVTIAGDSRVVIQDRSIIPPFRLVLDSFEARTGSLDMKSPGRKTPFELKARIGKYSSLSAEGTIKPFAETRAIELGGKLESFDLRKLAPYAAERFAFDLKSGQLNADIQLLVEKNILDFTATLLIVKLRGEKVEEEDRFAGLFGIPLKKSLSTLLDKDGNIHLRVTARGDLSDPQFRMHDVVTKAIASAIKEGAVSYFGPLGVTFLTGVTLPPGTFYVAKKLLEWATTLRFKPVEFIPLKEQLGDENIAYLDQMANLLKGRPDVQIVICGLSTLADLRAYRGEPVRTEREKEPEEKLITKDEMKWMLALSQRRSETVKDYLVQIGGIDAGRLVLCSPEVEESDKAPPRVEIGI